jgi:hypothetical protein
MTLVLRIAAGCEVLAGGGRRAAVLLAPGDTVTLGRGLTRVVGHAMRSVIIRDAWRRALWPVAVAAGSLGEGLPATDLVVAPDQVLPVTGGLGAPARCLVDGVAISRVQPAGGIDLVELHFDMSFTELAPDDALPGLVESVVARRLPPAAAPHGALDRADHRGVAGWARDPARPGQPLLLTLEIDGAARGLILADRYREDLAQALEGGGHHGFGCDLAPALSRRDFHRVVIRRAWDGAPVWGGEMLVDRAPPIDTALAALDDLAPEARARALSLALMALGEAARG